MDSIDDSINVSDNMVRLVGLLNELSRTQGGQADEIIREALNPQDLLKLHGEFSTAIRQGIDPKGLIPTMIFPWISSQSNHTP